MDALLRSLSNVNETQDNLFGPALRGNNVGFDFTLRFERSILSILPSALFLLYVPLRVYWLRKERKKTEWSLLAMGKQVGTLRTAY